VLKPSAPETSGRVAPLSDKERGSEWFSGRFRVVCGWKTAADAAEKVLLYHAKRLVRTTRRNKLRGGMGDLVVFRPRLRGNLNQQRVRDDDRQCRRGVEVQRWTKLGDGQVPGRVMDEMLCDGGRGRMQGVGSPKDDWIDRLAPPLSLFVVPVPDSVLSQITRVLLDARYSLLRVRRAAESRSRRRWMQSGRWGSDAWEEGLYLDLTRFRPGSRARCEKRSGLAGALPRPRLVDNQLPLIRRVLVLGP
jgi:hypothetical protein